MFSFIEEIFISTKMMISGVHDFKIKVLKKSMKLPCFLLSQVSTEENGIFHHLRAHLFMENQWIKSPIIISCYFYYYIWYNKQKNVPPLWFTAFLSFCNHSNRILWENIQEQKLNTFIFLESFPSLNEKDWSW